MIAKSVQLVTMGPLRRCGSHFLRVRLEANPQCCAPYPLHIIDIMHLLPLYGNLQQPERFRALIRHVVGLRTFVLQKWHGPNPDPDELFYRLREAPRNIHTIALALLRDEAVFKGASVAVDKSLDNILDWKNIVLADPKMLFIIVARDMRDQVASMTREIIYKFHPLLNAKIVVDAYGASNDLTRHHPNQIKTVKFENMIRSTQQSIEEICRFIGIDFLPEMLEAYKSPEVKAFSDLSTLWQENSKPPDERNIGKYRRQLTGDQIAQVETLTRQIMAQYGYQPDTPADIEITEEMMTAAERFSDEAKDENWQSLKEGHPEEYALRGARLRYIEQCREELLESWVPPATDDDRFGAAAYGESVVQA
jgi:hypothetical protein